MSVIARPTHANRLARLLQHHAEPTALAADHATTQTTVVLPHEETERFQASLALGNLAVGNPNRGRIHVGQRQLFHVRDRFLATTCGRRGHALRLHLIFPE